MTLFTIKLFELQSDGFLLLDSFVCYQTALWY